MHRAAPVAILALLAAALLLLPLSGASARAGDGAKLEAHPMVDAQPGEFVRFVIEGKNWSRHYLETVLEVKDGQAYIEQWQTDEAGEKKLSLGWSGWAKVPDRIKPLEYQKVVADEMVELELDGKKLACRHIVVDQPENPPYPEPQVRREVWFTNDVPGWGRVKVKQGEEERRALTWGTMSQEELKKCIEAREKREHPPKKE